MRRSISQLLLAVDVLGVLAAIALRRGGRDLLGDLRSVDLPQPLELGGEHARALARDVL